MKNRAWHEVSQIVEFDKIAKEFVREKVRREVIVMAVADGYAMVRRPRCLPYVVQAKELVAWGRNAADAA